MKKRKLWVGLLLLGNTAGLFANGPDQLDLWFDEPTSLKGQQVWYSRTNNQWKNEPERLLTAGTQLGKVCRNWDKEWETRSLPLGNGSLGVNVMGSISAERLTVNEKSFWQGGPNAVKDPAVYWQMNKSSAHLLPVIREALSKGDYKTATRLTGEHFNSDIPYRPNQENPFRFGNFTTMGEFCIATGHTADDISHYVRKLSLDSAMTTVSYVSHGVDYKRRTFVSYPDQVIAMQFSASERGKQNLEFRYRPNPLTSGKFSSSDRHELIYQGALLSNGMRFTLRIHPQVKGGKLWVENEAIHVEGADEVCFLVTADTDYKVNFDPDFSDAKTYVGVCPDETTQTWMEHAAKFDFQQLLQQHYEDYSPLFKRVQLQLNPEETVAALPIDQRLKAYRKGKSDPGLETLFFQFGRYLLLASSRPGNMPANLQGIWQNNVDAPWRSDYHNNINVQMNYWPACVTQLPECMLPLVDYIRSLMKPGAVTAKSYFGARGWTAGISSNIFGFTAPLESQNMSFNFNPMAGPWLATHVWEYFSYTQDVDFLREVGYDILRSSALFTIDYLYRKPDGTYTASPSTSPEHGPVDEGATFVHAVAREILMDAVAASRVLQTDRELCKEWEQVLQHLAPYQIGRYGQLMEWSRDIDDPKDKHRHVNHLFCLYPGRTVSPVTTPELSQAAKVVLEHRGDGATGWSMGWKLNLWARLLDGNHAYTMLRNLLENGTFDNLWDSHPPFQIDGNFGGCAGMAEMLLQSHLGVVHLLPALPEAWRSGSVNSLLARGGFEVSMKWQQGQLVQADILSRHGGTCRLRYNDEEISFATERGESYRIVVEKGKMSLRH